MAKNVSISHQSGRDYIFSKRVSDGSGNVLSMTMVMNPLSDLKINFSIEDV